MKDGKELASLFFTAQVSTWDAKKSYLLLGDFCASEPRLDLRKRWLVCYLDPAGSNMRGKRRV